MLSVKGNRDTLAWEENVFQDGVLRWLAETENVEFKD